MSGELHDLWRPYAPSAACPWDAPRVQRLHRRAGYGAAWAEIQRDVGRGPEAAVEALLRGGQPHTPDFELVQRRLVDNAILTKRVEQLQAWWVYRMLYSGDPLRERLSLVWHDHFATSFQKLGDVRFLWQQNEVFRQNAYSPFAQLLRSVLADPAILLYLDAQSNKRGNINENLGRELLELFTIGIGHYDEHDVREASRALTGWTVVDGEFAFVADEHDAGDKTIFGETAPFDGNRLLAKVLEHPATAVMISRKLCEEFLGEAATAAAVEALAEMLAADELRIATAVRTILRSELFLGDESRDRRFLAPCEFVLSAVRALEVDGQFPSTMELADWITRCGQQLFFPPNVAGWPGGRSWFTQRAVLARANFADALVQGRMRGVDGPLALAKLAERHGASNHALTMKWFATLLLGRESVPSLEAEVVDLGQFVISVLASPDAQLS